jgi:hypothetical protein
MTSSYIYALKYKRNIIKGVCTSSIKITKTKLSLITKEGTTALKQVPKVDTAPKYGILNYRNAQLEKNYFSITCEPR